jgi:hypothetical protein
MGLQLMAKGPIYGEFDFSKGTGMCGSADGYARGGTAKSTVNSAGNYTKPTMRKALFSQIKSASVQGTAAGQWSARKAQLLAKRYKEKGGGYK